MSREQLLHADPAPACDLEVEQSVTNEPLRECVRHAVERYFANLDGHAPSQFYQMVLAEIEAPLLEVVMRHTRGNQSKAAALLGINRGTLRKKLRQYGLD